MGQKLEDMTREQLEDFARQHQLDMPQSGMSKDQLIQAIQQHGVEFGEMMQAGSEHQDNRPGQSEAAPSAPEGASPSE